jgi:hypothetical protein
MARPELIPSRKKLAGKTLSEMEAELSMNRRFRLWSTVTSPWAWTRGQTSLIESCLRRDGWESPNSPSMPSIVHQPRVWLSRLSRVSTCIRRHYACYKLTDTGCHQPGHTKAYEGEGKIINPRGKQFEFCWKKRKKFEFCEIINPCAENNSAQ